MPEVVSSLGLLSLLSWCPQRGYGNLNGGLLPCRTCLDQRSPIYLVHVSGQGSRLGVLSGIFFEDFRRARCGGITVIMIFYLNSM